MYRLQENKFIFEQFKAPSVFIIDLLLASLITINKLSL